MCWLTRHGGHEIVHQVQATHLPEGTSQHEACGAWTPCPAGQTCGEWFLGYRMVDVSNSGHIVQNKGFSCARLNLCIHKIDNPVDSSSVIRKKLRIYTDRVKSYWILSGGNTVAQWSDHSLAVRKFPGSNLVRTSPVHPAVKWYPISDSSRYCQIASIWAPNTHYFFWKK